MYIITYNFSLLFLTCCGCFQHTYFFFFTQTTIVSGRLAWAGLFKNGKSYGAHWRGCFGGGFLYGSVGPNGLFTGNKNAYIYPGKK